MIVLDATTQSLEVATSSSATMNYVSSYVDITTTAFTPGSAQGVIGGVTTTTVVAAPAASTQRQVKAFTIRNAGSAANTVTVKKDVSATEYTLFSATLSVGESLQYQDGSGWQVFDANGRLRTMATDVSGYTGKAGGFYKVGTAPEAAGQWYSWAKDSGNPGAWAPGTPGLNGRATDGTTASDAGCLLLSNPVTGANYLTDASFATTVAAFPWLFDVLWVNSGIGVTTTTIQSLTSVAFPARDLNGSANGEGLWAGILVTTATTQAGAVTTITLSYTNSDGTAGKTATMASFPATAVIGTVVWFQLAAGDKGVRSIQGITLGTTLTAGAISLIVARPLYSCPSPIANVGGQNAPPMNPGIRLYNGTCILPIGLMSATTATTLAGTATFMER